MTGNLIIGAGGHAKVIADMILRQGMQVLGFLDDNPLLIGQEIFNLPVLGKIDTWKSYKPNGLVIGIGDNAIRRKIVQNLESSNPPWRTVIHPNAVIATAVQLGEGSVVMAGAIINVDTIVGKHSIINTGATVDHDCRIGDFVHIAPGANLAGDVHVDDGTFLGIGSSVIQRQKIGANSTIGAGGVVVCDIPPNVIAKGVPARWE